MKSFAWISLLLSHILYGQLCLIDAKDMFSVGSSEIVNGEKLTLFCCNDGHQMWLSNYPDENLINKIDSDQINLRTAQDVGYPILLDVASNMGFIALLFSILIPLNHMGGLMVFAMVSTSFGTLTVLASLIQILKIKKV